MACVSDSGSATDLDSRTRAAYQLRLNRAHQLRVWHVAPAGLSIKCAAFQVTFLCFRSDLIEIQAIGGPASEHGQAALAAVQQKMEGTGPTYSN